MFLIFKNGKIFLNSILKISFFVSVFLFLNNNQILNFDKCNKNNKGDDNVKNFINKLNSYEKFRQPKYIIFSDYYSSKYCSDINAYTVFDYFLKKNYSNAYYIINIESDLYKNLNEQNKTDNLILNFYIYYLI